MSRIKTDVLKCRRGAVDQIRKAIENAERWLDLYALDKRCDAEDRETIAHVRAQLHRIRQAI